MSKRREAYEAYINSPEWRVFRSRIITMRGRKCELCPESQGRMELHHLTYANFGNENDEDVQLLCPRCHAEVDGRRRKFGNGSNAAFKRWFAASLEGKEAPKRKRHRGPRKSAGVRKAEREIKAARRWLK